MSQHIDMDGHDCAENMHGHCHADCAHSVDRGDCFRSSISVSNSELHEPDGCPRKDDKTHELSRETDNKVGLMSCLDPFCSILKIMAASMLKPYTLLPPG